MRGDLFVAAEQLAANFYAWERRGRGWDIWPYPCELEPAFRPFLGHFIPSTYVDDTRRPGIFSRLFGSPAPAAAVTAPEEDEPTPELLERRAQDLIELQVLLPSDFELPPEACEQLLSSLSFCNHPVSFELVATTTAISLQLACDRSDRAHVAAQLRAFAPDAALIERTGFLAGLWCLGTFPPLIVELGLSNEFMRPLRGLKNFSTDPYRATVGALSGLGVGEIAVVQSLFTAAVCPWSESILRAVHDEEGAPLELLGPDLAKHAFKKLEKPLFACRLRLAVQARTHERRIDVLRQLMGAFAQYALPLANELIALESADLPDQELDLLERSSHQSGMLLNCEELSGLVHLPGPEVNTAKLERGRKRTKPAPAFVRVTSGVLLGTNEHQGEICEVRAGPEQRLRHTYVVGGSGTGKSTLLLNLILQDLEAGRGLGVLDPHGDLVDQVVARMPQARIPDVVLLDPADEDYPISFNILSAHSELERTLLSSDLVGVFRRLSTSWGDQMTAVLGNAVLAFLESSEGGTLLDLRRFLVDKEFRSSFLATVADPEVVFFWQKEYPLLKSNPQASILTRLDAFLRPKLVRNMVGQRGSALDFRRLIDSRGVMLCKLSHGAIGEENAHLLGALLVAKLQQLALSRQDTAEASREQFYLYLDEFQHFVTPSMASLLSGVRKYRLGLVLAHQNLVQLSARSPELEESVLANAGTRICFRLGDQDARRLDDGFSFFDARDLQNLGIGEAIARVERSENDFNLRTPASPALDPEIARRRTEEVVASSRARWATPAARSEPFSPAPPPALAAEPVPVRPAPVKVSSAAAEVPALVKAIKPPPTPGRGGQQHKYLQSLISKFGQDRGFKVEVERVVLDGHGHVDVSFEREDLKVAFEVTVTTPTGHEIGNMQKCLAAGYQKVVMVATDKRAVARLARAAQDALSEDQKGLVCCLVPDEIPGFLDSLNLPPARTQTVAGYKVTTVAASKPDADKKTGVQHTIREIITKSLKRRREG